MPLPQRGRTIALVLLGIFFVADADVLAVEQSHDGGENGFARELAFLQVLFDAAPETRQRLAELEQALVFCVLALGSEVRMIAVLLAAPRIDSRGLQMSVRIRAKPGVFVSRRQADGIEPIDLVAVGDAIAFSVEIGPVTAHPLPADPRLGVAAMAKHFRGQRILLDSSTGISARMSGRVPVVARRGD